MSITNRERCYFDLRFGFSDSKYIGIHVSRQKYQTLFCGCVIVEFVWTVTLILNRIDLVADALFN